MVTIIGSVNHVMKDDKNYFAWISIDNIPNKRIHISKTIYEYVKDEGYGLYHLEFSAGVTITGHDYVALYSIMKCGKIGGISDE